MEREPIEVKGTILRTPDLDPEGYDVFIVHGKNWANNLGFTDVLKRKAKRMLGKEPKKFRLKLSKDSRITALSAGIIWQEYKSKREKPPIFIFSTGKTAGRKFEGQELPSEAQAMRDYLKVRFPEIPDDNIKLEDYSYDTATNIVNCKKMIANLESQGGTTIRRVSYLTVGYHLPRVYLLMDYYDLAIQKIYPTEQVIRSRSRRHDLFVQRYTHSKEWKKHQRGEALDRLEATLDPGQKKQSFVSKIIRHQ